ncbi:MAG: hypothetical protein LDL51_01095 [Chloroflexi bacterium]|nr:hypothetical protein [Chloroflexota bacterium]
MLNSRNRFDKKDSLELGERAEALFAAIARGEGWRVSPSLREENIAQHWDFEIVKGAERFKVEVKSAKRLRRADDELRTEFVWVELKNVRGEVGWLFGKADLIAFETADSFLFVRRLDLLRVVNSKVNLVAKVSRPLDALYKIYRREGRKDKLTLLPVADIEEIKWMEWRKER